MSIHYTLYLSGDESLADVTRSIAARLGIELKTDQATEAVEGLVLDAKAVKPPVDQFIELDHGLRPRIALTMVLDKDDLRTAEASVVAVLIASIEHNKQDVLLLRQDETVAYRRTGDESELSESDPIWAKEENRTKLERRRRGTLA